MMYKFKNKNEPVPHPSTKAASAPIIINVVVTIRRLITIIIIVIISSSVKSTPWIVANRSRYRQRTKATAMPPRHIELYTRAMP